MLDVAIHVEQAEVSSPPLFGVSISCHYRGADKSLARTGRKQAEKHIKDARTISTTSRRELSSSIFFPLQGKAPKEIHAILTETLACIPSWSG